MMDKNLQDGFMTKMPVILKAKEFFRNYIQKLENHLMENFEKLLKSVGIG